MNVGVTDATPEHAGDGADPRMKQVLEVVDRGRRFLITGHMNPDGDVLGSMSSLALVLQRLGKETVVYNRDPAPSRYAFLPLMDRLVQKVPDEAFDAVFIVDCCEPQRVGPGFAQATGEAPIGAIDHHAAPPDDLDFHYHDAGAAATGVLIYRLARALGVEVDEAIGQGIFVALVTDTGNFRYSNAGPEAFGIASALVDVGVDPHAISRQLYENEPLARLKLLGDALGRLTLSDEGRIAWLLMPEGCLEEHGASAEMLDGAVDYGRQVAGVEVSCLLRRNDDDPSEFRMSLRSAGAVDVQAVARKLGGGGHRMASGGRFAAASMEAAAAKVRTLLLDAFEA